MAIDPEREGLADHGTAPAPVTDPAEALRQREAHFDQLISGIADYAIFLLDPDGRVKTWNKGAERIKGYLPHEIIGKHFGVFYTPEDQAASLPEAVLRTAGETGRFEADAWRVRKDGSRFFANVVVDALRTDDGRRAWPSCRRWAPARLRQDHPRHDRAARHGAAACTRAEDGGSRAADRRRRARLQQHPDHRDGQPRHHPARTRRCRARRRGGRAGDGGRAPRGEPDAPAAGVLAAAGARSQAGGRQQRRDQRGRADPAFAGRADLDRDEPRRRPLAVRARREPDPECTAQSRDQRARCDAGRRQAHHRDRELRSGRSASGGVR